MPAIIRTALGLFLAPIAGGMTGLLIYLGYSSIVDPTSVVGGDTVDTLRFGVTAGAMYGGLLGVVPSFLVGWPLHIVMQRLRLTQWWAYIALGLLLAAVAGLLVAPTFGMSVIYFGAGIMLMLAMSGAIGGLVFWLIRRPDRDAPASPPAAPQVR